MELQSIVAMDGRPLMAESMRMLEYLDERAKTLSPRDISERLKAAALELEGVVASVDEKDARRRPFPGKWHIADVVDHISQTQIRGAEELRHLLSGGRPPGPPVYEALKSGASEWAPWPSLVRGLQDANREMLSVIEIGSAARDSNNERGSVDEIAGATVCTIVVANCKLPHGEIVPQIFITELNWRQYALLQRLHLLDHRTQIRKLLRALREAEGQRERRNPDPCRLAVNTIKQRSGGEGGIIPNAICCWDALGCVFSIPQPIASQGFIFNPLKPHKQSVWCKPRVHVVGMVLVDCGHPDQENRLPPEVNKIQSLLYLKSKLWGLAVPLGIPRLLGLCGVTVECHWQSQSQGSGGAGDRCLRG